MGTSREHTLHWSVPRTINTRVVLSNTFVGQVTIEVESTQLKVNF